MPATEPSSHRPDHGELVFESTEPERTEAFLSATFGIPMKISGSHESYRFRLARLDSGPLQLSTIDHTPTTAARSDALPDHLAVVHVHRGVVTNVRLDDHLGPGDVSVYSQPGQKIHNRVAAARFTAAFVPMQALADAARNGPEDQLGPLLVHSLRPPDPAMTRHWLRTIGYVTDSLRSHPDSMAHPLLSGAAARLVAATLLTTFPNTWNAVPHHHDRTDATPTTLARAIAFIDSNANNDITSLDIARAAYVTVRAVQLAFRRHLDTTPTQYLRRVRLERAHEDLRAANSNDDTTVHKVAASWGFPDPGRFAAHYRRAYGQLPSHTLRT